MRSSWNKEGMRWLRRKKAIGTRFRLKPRTPHGTIIHTHTRREYTRGQTRHVCGSNISSNISSAACVCSPGQKDGVKEERPRTATSTAACGRLIVSEGSQAGSGKEGRREGGRVDSGCTHDWHDGHGTPEGPPKEDGDAGNSDEPGDNHHRNVLDFKGRKETRRSADHFKFLAILRLVVIDVDRCSE